MIGGLIGRPLVRSTGPGRPTPIASRSAVQRLLLLNHVGCKDTKERLNNGRNGSLLARVDPRRGWDFIYIGRGDVPWEDSFRMLHTIGYEGPISMEWEDAGMDWLIGAPEAPAFVRSLTFDPPTAALSAR